MNTLWHATWYTFSYLVFFYSMAIMASYLVLVWLSYREQKRKEKEVPDDETLKYMLKSSPLTPAVSVIAPAYNEHVNIITNAYSLLGLDYPSFEVIIVNDGSTDATLDLLKQEFDLEEVSLSVEYKVPCTRIVAIYKSKDKRFSNLTVVDKVNGGRKADSTNAGINVCQTPYFVCTDADCIIDPMALYRMMWLVINSHEPMIGVGATMLMSNDCDIDWVKRQVAVTDENKRLDDLKKKEEKKDENKEPPSLPVRFFDWLVNLPVLWGILACFQQLEYLRSFLIGKLGWSGLNALPNISGGFGLFDTEVAISSGGYDRTSMAEDMDMLLRMVTYMCNNDLPFRVGQVTQACCWTKGPVSAKGLFNQRSRWGRGLFEIIQGFSGSGFTIAHQVAEGRLDSPRLIAILRQFALCIVSEGSGDPYDTVLLSRKLFRAGPELGVFQEDFREELSDHLDQIGRMEGSSLRRCPGKREIEAVCRLCHIHVQIEPLKIHLLPRRR